MGAAASYPRVVLRASLDVRGSARRYAGWLQMAALLLVVLTLSAARTHAQVEISVDPAMVKGPRDAAVTIIEFSDYQ